jgi:hypothetical protein
MNQAFSITRDDRMPRLYAYKRSETIIDGSKADCRLIAAVFKKVLNVQEPYGPFKVAGSVWP